MVRRSPGRRARLPLTPVFWSRPALPRSMPSHAQHCRCPQVVYDKTGLHIPSVTTYYSCELAARSNTSQRLLTRWARAKVRSSPSGMICPKHYRMAGRGRCAASRMSNTLGPGSAVV